MLEGQFRFKALKKGEHKLIIMTETESGVKRPSARIFVSVGDKGTITSLLLPAVVILLPAFVYFLKRIRRV
jgi:hypothetical protein